MLTDTCKAPVTPWGTSRWQEQVITPQSHSSGDNFSPGLDSWELPGLSCLCWMHRIAQQGLPALISIPCGEAFLQGIGNGGQRGVKVMFELCFLRGGDEE